MASWTSSSTRWKRFGKWSTKSRQTSRRSKRNTAQFCPHRSPMRVSPLFVRNIWRTNINCIFSFRQKPNRSSKTSWPTSKRRQIACAPNSRASNRTSNRTNRRTNPALICEYVKHNTLRCRGSSSKWWPSTIAHKPTTENGAREEYSVSWKSVSYYKFPDKTY